jgi:hypothetical protein
MVISHSYNLSKLLLHLIAVKEIARTAQVTPVNGLCQLLFFLSNILSNNIISGERGQCKGSFDTESC